MKFGLFGSAKLNKINNDIDSSLSYNEWIDYNVEAERLCFESISTVEHHFTGVGSSICVFKFINLSSLLKLLKLN